MTPWKHAESSAARWGGRPADYIAIHNFFDETKAFTGDWTHRVLRHHSAGVQWAIEKFGHVIVNADDRLIPVKSIAEQHIEEDCGYIPTPQDWLVVIANNPEDWMLKVKTKSSQKMTQA
jgi:hypothetical protein